MGFNPFRREADAFRVLVYFAAVMVVIIVAIVVVRAVS
jgi:hypothetical protein